MSINRPLSDAELDALLRALPREAPSTGFADRVMAQVQLPATAPRRIEIPWRAVVGVLTLDLAVAAALLVWFGDDLIRVLIGGVHGVAKAVVGLGSLDLITMREWLVAGLFDLSAGLPPFATLSTVLLLGTIGSLLSFASLGRLARGATLPTR